MDWLKPSAQFCFAGCCALGSGFAAGACCIGEALLGVPVCMRLAGMKMYEIALKGYGRGLPAWLAYRVKAASAEEAVCKAKKQAAEHYIEFEWFEVQSIGEVRT